MATLTTILVTIAGRASGHGIVLVVVAVVDATLAVGNALAMVVLVLPPIMRRRRMAVIEGRDLDDADVAVAPVVSTEEKPVPHDNRGAPEETAVAGVIAVAGPGRPAHGLVVGPPPAAIDERGIVIRDVDHVGIAVTHDDRAFLAHHPHVLGLFQVARLVGPLAQGLDGVHDLFLLREEGVTQTSGPLEVLIHAVQDLREGEHGLHAGIPGLVCGGTHRVLTLQLGVGAGETRRLHHLEGVGSGHQQLGEEFVRIQRHWREHLVEFGLCEERGVLRFGLRCACCEQGEGKEERSKKASREGDHTLSLAGRYAGPVRWNAKAGPPLTRRASNTATGAGIALP